MTITITSTDLITEIKGMRCRIWRGITAAGVPCDIAIPMLRVREGFDTGAFEQELVKLPHPDECTVVDMRYVW